MNAARTVCQAMCQRRDKRWRPVQGALASGTGQQVKASAPWRGYYRNRYKMLGETPHLEAGDENDRLERPYRTDRNAVGAVQDRSKHIAGTLGWSWGRRGFTIREKTSAQRRAAVRKGRGSWFCRKFSVT